MNRIKPYLVILFIIWPLMTVFDAYLMHEQTSETKAKIDASTRVVANVYKINAWESGPRRGSKTKNFWAYYRAPTSNGTVNGEGPISETTYNLLNAGKIKTIDVYVGSYGSWPSQYWDRHASRVSWENWLLGAILGLCAAPFIYFAISHIPFGKSRQSLSKRWK